MRLDLKSGGLQREPLRYDASVSAAATLLQEPLHPGSGVFVFDSFPLETFENCGAGRTAQNPQSAHDLMAGRGRRSRWDQGLVGPPLQGNASSFRDGDRPALMAALRTGLRRELVDPALPAEPIQASVDLTRMDRPHRFEHAFQALLQTIAVVCSVGEESQDRVVEHPAQLSSRAERGNAVARSILLIGRTPRATSTDAARVKSSCGKSCAADPWRE